MGLFKKILVSILLALVFSRLLTFDPRMKIIGDGGDSWQFLFFIDAAKDNVVSIKAPFARSDTMRYPYGFDFSRSNDGAYAILTGALLSLIFSPLFAYNLNVALLLFSNIFLTYFSFEKLYKLIKPDIKVSVFTILSPTVAFALSPFVLARMLGHLNLAFVGGFPLFIYACFLLLKKIAEDVKLSWQDYLTLYLSILLISLGSLQNLLLLFWVVFFTVLAAYINPTTRGLIIKILRSFVFSNLSGSFFAFIAFFVVFYLIYGGYLKWLLNGWITLPSFTLRPLLSDLFIPNMYLMRKFVVLNKSPIHVENVATIGTIEVLLLLVMFLKFKSRIFRYVFLVFPIIALIILGYIPLPLYKEGARSVILASLLFSVLLLFSEITSKKWVGSIILFLLITERLLFSFYTKEPPHTLITQVSKLPGDSVLTIPVSLKEPFRDLIPVLTNKKLLDGYVHHIANTKEYYDYLNATPLVSLMCSTEEKELDIRREFKPEELRDFLEDNKVKSVLVFHGYSVLTIDLPECARAKQDWENFLFAAAADSYLKLAYSDKYIDLYIISPIYASK